jgi:transcriptional regulator with XRE-family HTH domain
MSVSSIERYREWARRVEDDPRLAAEELKLAFADELALLLETKGMRRTELAEKLETNRGYVTRILNTEYNLTIETMARIAHALDARISLHMHSKDSNVRWVETSSRASSDRIQHPQHKEHDSYNLPSRREVPVVADKPASHPASAGKHRRASGD